MKIRGLWTLVISAFVLSGTGCSSRSVQHSSLPQTYHVAQLPTPQSISPGLVAAPPMAKTAILPPSTMQSPHAIATKSDIQGMNYSAIAGTASYAAAAPDGSLWVLSDQPAGPDKYIWHYVRGSWSNISGLATRISVAPNGTLYAINSGGGAYSYSGATWTAFGGGCKDLTAAADGSLYVISNGGGADGAIWRYASGGWTQQPGSGNRIAASWDTRTYSNPGGAITPGGFYVINSAGSIYYLGSSGYVQIPGGASAIAPISGGLFVLGYPANSKGNGLFYYNLANPSWAAQSGSGVSVSTNGSSLYIISASGSIYSSPVSTVTGAPGSVPQALYAATFTFVNTTANGVEEFALGSQGGLAASPFSVNYGQFETGAPGGPPSFLLGYNQPGGIAVNSSGRAEIVNFSNTSRGFPMASNIDFAPCTVSSPYAGLQGWTGGGGAASFDADDNLWQLGNSGATSGAGITEYPAPQNQVPTTITTAAVTGGFSLPTRGGNAVAFDGQQNLWTLGTDSQGNAAVLNLGRSPHGVITPLSAIHGILTQLQNPVGIAIGPDNTVYVANAGAILAYAPGSGGNVAPAAVISGASTGIRAASALAVDALGDIFVGQATSPQILEFAPKSSGNTSPVAAIATQGSAVEGLAVGPLPFSAPMTVHPASITLNGQQSDEVIVWDSACNDQIQFASDNPAVYNPPSTIQTGHGLVVGNNATTTGTAHITATSSTGQSAVFTVYVVATPQPTRF